MAKQKTPRTPRRRADVAAELEQSAMRVMPAVGLEQRKIDFLNHKAEKELEVLAVDLVDAGAANYAAGIRMTIFTAIGLLLDLDEPELQSDLVRVKQHCDELIEYLQKRPPTAA